MLTIMIVTTGVAYANDERESNSGREIKEEIKVEKREKRAIGNLEKSKREDRLLEIEKFRRDSSSELDSSSTPDRKNDLKKLFEKKERKNLDSIQKKLENMAHGFITSMNRLKNLQDRLDSRMTKMEAEGKDTKVAREFLAESRLKIKSAEEGLDKVRAEISAEATLAAKLEVLRESKDELKSAYTFVREARVAFVKALGALKGNSGTRVNDASDTSDASNS